MVLVVVAVEVARSALVQRIFISKASKAPTRHNIMHLNYTAQQQHALLSRASPRPTVVRAARHRVTQRTNTSSGHQDASRPVHYAATQPPKPYNASLSLSYQSFEEEYRVMLHEQEVSLEHEADRLQHLVERLTACHSVAEKVSHHRLGSNRMQTAKPLEAHAGACIS